MTTRPDAESPVRASLRRIPRRVVLRAAGTLVIGAAVLSVSINRLNNPDSGVVPYKEGGLSDALNNSLSVAFNFPTSGGQLPDGSYRSLFLQSDGTTLWAGRGNRNRDIQDGMGAVVRMDLSTPNKITLQNWGSSTDGRANSLIGTPDSRFTILATDKFDKETRKPGMFVHDSTTDKWSNVVPGEVFYNLALRREGGLWAAGEDGVFECSDIQAGNWTKRPDLLSLPTGSKRFIHDIQDAGKYLILARRDDGLSIVPPTSPDQAHHFTAQTHPQIVKDNSFRSIVALGDDKYLLGTNSDVLRADLTADTPKIEREQGVPGVDDPAVKEQWTLDGKSYRKMIVLARANGGALKDESAENNRWMSLHSFPSNAVEIIPEGVLARTHVAVWGLEATGKSQGGLLFTPLPKR